jgi:hypothetical protein
MRIWSGIIGSPIQVIREEGFVERQKEEEMDLQQ